LCLVVGWSWLVSVHAQAQPQPKPSQKRGAEQDRRPDPGVELELIESTERSEDPLGIDDSTGKELDQAAARLPKPKPVVLLPAASQGAALSSIPGVRESAHELNVKLDQGLAFVSLRSVVVSTAKHAAELAYRVPLPNTGVVTRVAVCMVSASLAREQTARVDLPARTPEPRARTDCSEAAPEPHARAGSAATSSRVSATPIEDERGRALSLRISQLAPGGTLELHVAYVAEAKIVGGRVRFRVEPRGYDPNLANTQLHVEAPRLSDLSPGAELTVEPWTALALTASLAAKKSLRADTSASDGRATWSRHFEALPPQPAELRPTWLWIDASPSMEGPARSRVSATLAALLAVLPESTDVRAFVFAARASELGRFRADEAPLVQLSDATLLDLDAATQLSSVIALARRDLLRVRPRVVVLSDGLFDTEPRERAAMLGLSKAGLDTWLVTLGDGEPTLADAFEHVLRVAPLAEAALHDNDLAPLEDALRSIAAKAVRGLVAGEQLSRERAPEVRVPLRAGAHWLAYWTARDREQTRWSTPARVPPPSTSQEAPTLRSRTEATPAIAALPYLDRPAPVALADTGLPKESVLSMLRTQLVPQARACLRVDRKGRGDYAVGLAFHALFAEREIYQARVEGHIDATLRACLEAILPKLRVPAFSGRIRVRYPIHTERVEEPPVIELESATERQLERAFSPAPALP
jgi:hypothetical protein